MTRPEPRAAATDASKANPADADKRATGADATNALAVIVVNYRTPALTIECLASLDAERAALPNLRAIVVDGGSADGSAERIAEAIAARGYTGWATLLPLAVNGGFGYANNQAIFALRDTGALPAFLCLINPDARVRPGALTALRDRLILAPRAGAVGGRLEREDGAVQGSAFHFPSLRSEFCRGVRTDIFRRLLRQPPFVIASDTPRPAPWVTGAAVAFRAAALEDAGLFDDGFFLYFEETELMHRLHAHGWDIWHEPVARIVHLGGGATGLQDSETGGLPATRLPRYWYDSRRRYFVRTGGATHALSAGLAYLAGRLLWQARCLFTGRADDDPERSTRDFIAYGLWPRVADRHGRPPTVAAPAGQTPAWQRASAPPR
jgi:GT2 family glycosyltransferase